MKFYRLYNRTEAVPASGLLFLKREDAEKYKDVARWPYASTGFWPLPDGREVRLEFVDLRVEVLSLAAVVEPALAVAVMEREGRLGGAALLAGDCFDPGEWEACTPAELAHPVKGPLWERARLALQERT